MGVAHALHASIWQPSLFKMQNNFFLNRLFKRNVSLWTPLYVYCIAWKLHSAMWYLVLLLDKECWLALIFRFSSYYSAGSSELEGQGGTPPPQKKRAKIESQTFAPAPGPPRSPQIFWPTYGPVMFCGNIHNNFFYTDQNLLQPNHKLYIQIS